MKINRKILKAMFDELNNSPRIYHPSSHWKNLNQFHLEQIFSGDINNFKRSINMKYFNWGILGIIAHQMEPIMQKLARGYFQIFFRSSFRSYNKKIGNKITEFNFLTAQIYKVFVASLFEYVKDIDRLNILDNLTEPKLGNPFLIKHKDKEISQDLSNSVHEFYSLSQNLDLNKKLNFLEIGAGYGRTAYVVLKTLPKSTYTIIDIPLALYIAQEYLSKIFPHEKIFYFRSFKSYKEIKKEFESSRIRFLIPHQIQFLSKKYFHQTINISSFHEMKREQINHFLILIDKLTNGFFYTKQWKRSQIADNNFIKESEYPIPIKWKKIFQRRHPIQKMFFEALYKI